MSDDLDIYGLPGKSHDLSHEEVLGALANAASKMHDPVFQKALAARLAARRPIQKVPLSRERKWVLGFGPFHNVQPGAIEKIDVQPKCRFLGETIVAMSDGDAHLLAIYVGKTELLNLNGDSIAFSRLKEGMPLPPAWCNPALPMQIKFQNRGRVPCTVDAEILGKCVL